MVVGLTCGERTGPFYVAHISGGSYVEVTRGKLTITSWKPGQEERSGPLG